MSRLLDRLEKAMQEDAMFGDEHRGNAVVCELLHKAFDPDEVAARERAKEAQVEQQRRIIKQQQLARANRMLADGASGAKARRKVAGKGVGAPAAQRQPTRSMLKPAVAKHPTDDAKIQAAAAMGGAMTPERAEAAINDAVIRGKISGHEAIGMLKRIRARR